MEHEEGTTVWMMFFSRFFQSCQDNNILLRKLTLQGNNLLHQENYNWLRKPCGNKQNWCFNEKTVCLSSEKHVMQTYMFRNYMYEQINKHIPRDKNNEKGVFILQGA